MEITDEYIRQPCKEVTQFDDNIVRIVKQMFKRMHKWQGIGLAANQVGIPFRIFVMKVGKHKYACINPKMTRWSAEVKLGEEGCLSVPNRRANIYRRKSIVIEYYTEYGKKMSRGFEGLEARCVQHEMDHLEGKLCIDY